jgi:hypothetical protein
MKKLQDFIGVPSVFRPIYLTHFLGVGREDGKGERNLKLLYEL